MKRTKYEEESDEGDYDEEEAEQGLEGAISLTESFFATADPRDTLVVSPQLKQKVDTVTEEYYALRETDPDQLMYGTHEIFPTQYVIAHTFMSTKGITSLHAKTGFGKTLVGIAVAELSDVCLILVPGTVIPVWLKRLKHYGMFNPGSANSEVLLYSKKFAKTHLIYLTSSAGKAALAKRDQVIILAAHKNVDEVMRDILTSKIVNKREFTVVLDEAHKIVGNIGPWLQEAVKSGLVTRELLMSASELTPKVIKANAYGKIDYTIEVLGSNEMPEDNWIIKLMDSNSYADNPVEWLTAVKKIAADHDHLVFVSGLDERGSLIQQRAFRGKELLEYRGQQGFAGNFSKSDNIVAFLTMKVSTGLNLNADAMVILNPGESTTEQLIQMTKRIIRPDNPNRELDIYMLCGTPKEYFRVMYAKAFSIPTWPFGREEVVNTSMVYKAIATMRLAGINHETVDRVDLCVFLADYAELEMKGKLTRPYEQILEWWEENKLPTTVLNKDIIGNLIIL